MKFLSSELDKGTIVNRALPFLHLGSLEITLNPINNDEFFPE